MLESIDLGEPIATRIEKALLNAGKEFSTDYSNRLAPYVVEGRRLSFPAVADAYLPGGWDGIFELSETSSASSQNSVSK